MSVIGIDIGNEKCVIAAAAKRGGIDVLLNHESNRETPAVVSFGEKQRFLGCAGAAFATVNPKSTVSQVKRLIGKLFNDPSVQEDLKFLPFATIEGPRGGVLIELEYLKKKMVFTPVEILGMLFTHLKQITEKNLECPVADCVIGIPSYFTDLQRREYLDAACIAGLRPVMLMHDCTAIALGYGMYKNDLSNSRPTNVMFIDIGQCDTQVAVVAFEQGQMKILAHSFDLNLGGRDFVEVLFKHFAAKFQEQYKINVYSNSRACIRLRASCEKLKKVLSANAEAPISIECLIGYTDVKGFITREEFENLSSQLLERVTFACNKALKDSGLSVDKIHTIELVGSGSRIPAIKKILTLFFQKKPKRTQNASECVARGCALRCAMLSPTLVVRDYKVQDLYPYSIAIIPFDELKDKRHQEFMVFSKGSPFPGSSVVTHSGKSSTFYIQVSHSKETDIPAGLSPKVGRFRIGHSETSAAEGVKVELEVKLNDNGIVEIGSASLLEYEQPRNPLYYYLEKVTGSSQTRNLPFSENLDVATTKDELHYAKESEKMLAEQDRKVGQTKDQRNTLESFVYDTRSKLSNAYGSFASDSEKQVVKISLQETEDWLYEDSDDDESDYTGKLEYLKKLLEPIENRYKEEKARANAIKAMLTCIAKYRSLADSQPTGLKEKLKNECNRAEKWLDGISQENSSPKTSSSSINEIKQTFESGCKGMMRPKTLFSRHEPVDSNKWDQRNSLKLFVSDTHRKISSAYRSFATDSDKEVITNVLKETEDWLRKDSDDEPEQDYTGKLEYLKKLLEPLENRYKEEIARAEATKALQMRIAGYRSLADSLIIGRKEEVKNVCNLAEEWLRNISQQHSSLEINQLIDQFESECIDIMKPKPAFPKYDEPQDSDQMDQPVYLNQLELLMDLKQSDQPVDWNRSDEPMDLNQSDQPVDSNKIDQPLDMNESDQAADSNERDQTLGLKQKGPSHGFEQKRPAYEVKQKGPTSEVKQKGPTSEVKKKESTRGLEQRRQPVKLNKRDQPVYLNQLELLMDLKQSDQPVDWNRSDEPMDLNQSDQPVDSNKIDQPLDMNESDQAADSNERDQTLGLKQKGPSHGFEQKRPANEVKQKGPTSEVKKKESTRGLEQRRQPVKLNKRDQPVYLNQLELLMDLKQSDQPVDWNRSDEPMDLNQSDQPVDSNKIDQPLDMNESDQAADSNERDQTLGLKQKGPSHGFEQKRPAYEVKQKGPTSEVKKKESTRGLEQRRQPVKLNKRDQPVYLNQLELLMDLKQSDQPVDWNRSDEPMDLNQSDQPVDSNKIDQPLDMNESDQAADSNERDQTLGLKQKGPSHGFEQKRPAYEVKQKGPTSEVKKKESTRGLEQRRQPVKLNKRDQPVYLNQLELLMDLKQSDQPVDWNRSDEPMDLNQSDQPVDSNKIDQPLDMNESDQAADSNERDQTLGLKQNGPSHGFEQKRPAYEVKQKGPTSEVKKKESTRGLEQRHQPVKLNKRDQLVVMYSNKRDQLVDSNRKDQPTDSNIRDQLVDSNKRDKPVDTNKKDQSTDSNRRDQTLDSNKRDKPVDLNRRDQTMDPNKKDQPWTRAKGIIAEQCKRMINVFRFGGIKRTIFRFSS